MDPERRVSILLLVVGALLTAMGQVELPHWKPFSAALAGLGYALAAIARSDQVLGTKRGPAPPPADPPRPPAP
ncbi:MAG TPA: hypothetical protein VN646_16825 [Candidatus Acidoferrum sp.]|nr:hypothetical protein [Candidatus Acidoferrum sp.]